jgi:hypothetical protein
MTEPEQRPAITTDTSGLRQYRASIRKMTKAELRAERERLVREALNAARRKP